MKKALYLVITILLITLVIGCGDPELDDSTAAFELGMAAYEKGDYEEAVNQFLQMIDRDPNFEKAEDIYKMIYWTLLDEVKSNYEMDNLQDARKALERLEKLGMLEDEEQYSEAHEWVDKITVAESDLYYISGMEHYEADEAYVAFINFRKVLPGGKYFEETQAKIDELLPIIIQQFIDRADEAVSRGEFDSAKFNLEVALTYCRENKEVLDYLSKIDDLEEAYKEREFKASCNTYEYRVLNKDAEILKGERIRQRGKVLQIIEGSDTASIRLAVTPTRWGWSSSDVLYVVHYGRTTIYEDDVITIYGTIDGFHTYTSVAGHRITLPKVIAKYYEK